MRALAVWCALGGIALAGCSSEGADPAEARTEPSASAAATAGAPTYVALGDSYTAAPGVPETTDAACQRSSSNYPSLVAAEVDLALVDVSCSGADTLALVGVQETGDGPVPAQFGALTGDVRLVTMGMGGNDEGLFRDLVTTCLSLASADPTGSPCRDAMSTPAGDTAMNRIATIQTRLTSALVGINDRAPDADVVLVGYPQLVPRTGTCESLPLADGDYAYVRELTVALGAATAQAAADADAGYADVLRASEGHHVCAGPDAWVNGIANDDGRAAAPLHPFAEEQAAVAQLVLDALKPAAS